MQLNDKTQVISELVRRRVVINQASIFHCGSCSQLCACISLYLCLSLLTLPSMNTSRNG
jgi:hypothetical protein